MKFSDFIWELVSKKLNPEATAMIVQTEGWFEIALKEMYTNSPDSLRKSLIAYVDQKFNPDEKIKSSIDIEEMSYLGIHLSLDLRSDKHRLVSGNFTDTVKLNQVALIPDRQLM